jgi:hypothetical protein
MLLSHLLFIFSQRYATILLDYYRRLYYVINSGIVLAENKEEMA